MIRIPAHKQIDPAKQAGQIVNPVQPTPRLVPGSLAAYLDDIEQRGPFHAAAERLVQRSKVAA